MSREDRAKLPRTRAALAKVLSDAACAGYFAGFRDHRNGRDIDKSAARRVRIQIRAELARWMGGR